MLFLQLYKTLLRHSITVKYLAYFSLPIADMKYQLLLLHLIFFPVIFFPGFNAMQAQTSCQCSVASEQQFGQLIQRNDTVGINRLIISLKSNYNKNCSVNAYDMEIAYLLHQHQLDNMFLAVQQQEKFTAALPCSETLMANVYLNYAGYYSAKNDYEHLSKYAFKALETAEASDDKKHQLKAITYVVYLFTRQDQDAKNWDYIKKAEKIIVTLEDDYTAASHYNWLAFEYENKYTLTERPVLLDSAMAFAIKAKAIAGKYSDYEQLIRCFRVFEACAYHRAEPAIALANMDSALYYARLCNIPSNLASLYLSKAWDLIDLKENAAAIRWQDTSIFYAEQYQQGSPASMKIYSEAVQVYEAAGNLPKAMDAFKKYDHLKDSLFTLQRTEKINELEQRYEKTKNEKEIRELSQEKKIYLLFSVAGLFGLIAVGFFIRQQSFKSKQKIMEAEQRLNRARMNPHFFFNALSSLQSIALQENDGKALAINLSRFSHIMRETLESTYKEYITIEAEIDFLNKYLGLQKLRFPGKFSFEIHVSDNLDPIGYFIPTMILQPFVENSIEHGFTGIDYAGLITLDFNLENDRLQIKISDNGKGFASETKTGTEHISRASQIIRDRFFLLNSTLKSKAGFSIQNNTNEKGVAVVISLPLLLKQDITKI